MIKICGFLILGIQQMYDLSKENAFYESAGDCFMYAILSTGNFDLGLSWVQPIRRCCSFAYIKHLPRSDLFEDYALNGVAESVSVIYS